MAVLFWRLFLGEIPLPTGSIFGTQPWSAHVPADFHGPRNDLLSDVTFQIYPWHALVWEGLRSFRLPLWNPWNSGGMPLLANDQCAPLAPLSLLGAFLPVARGLALTVPLKILIAGSGMALFLRRLKCGRAGIWIGSVSFMLSGFMVVWLGWPQAQVGMVLPWLFWSAEGLVAEGGVRWIAALAGSIAVGLLGGHVETSAHETYAVALYALARAIPIWRAQRWTSVSRLGQFSIAITAGIAVAGIQLVPLADYLSRSAILELRATSQPSPPQPGFLSLSWVAPGFLGRPDFAGSEGGTYLYELGSNFNEQTGYAGLAVLALAGAAFVRRRRGAALALAATGFAAVSIVYGGPARDVLLHLPALRLAANQRFLLIIGFVLASLGAIGLTAIEEEPRAARLAGAAAAAVTAMMVAQGVAFHLRVGRWAPRTVRIAGLLDKHFQFALWIPLGILLSLSVALFLATRSDRVRRILIAAFALLTPIDMLAFAWNYNPTISAKHVYPSIPESRFLRQHAGEASTIWLGWGIIPNSNILYGIRDLRSYDPVVDAHWWHYFEAMAPHEPTTGQYLLIRKPNLTAFEVAGVRFIGSPADADLSGIPLFTGNERPLTGLRDGILEQTFLVPPEGARAIQLKFHTYGRVDHCRLIIRIDGAAGPPHLATAMPCATLSDSRWQTFALERELAGGTRATLQISMPGATAADQLGISATDSPPEDVNCKESGEPCHSSGESRPLQLAIQVVPPGQSRLLRAWEDSDTIIWEDPSARPAVYYADAIKVAAIAESFRLISKTDELRGNLATLMEAAVAAEPGREVNPPQMKRLNPERIEISTDVARPRLLVVNQSYDPGWIARIDGAPTPVIRTNVVFQGVVVPPGRHVVSLEYRPKAVLIGEVASAAGLLVLALIIAGSSRARWLQKDRRLSEIQSPR